MTQAVKPVSKYRKHASKAFQLPLLNEAIKCFIGLLRKTKDVGMQPMCHERRTRKALCAPSTWRELHQMRTRVVAVSPHWFRAKVKGLAPDRVAPGSFGQG